MNAGDLATPRGIRNRNPGNLERVPGVIWRGQAARQSDPRFVVFDAPVWGIRAMARVLTTYYERHQRRSVRRMIERWAPPGENRTHAYMLAVASRLGVGVDETLARNEETWSRLCAAITRHENGVDPYPATLYREAVRLAWGK